MVKVFPYKDKKGPNQRFVFYFSISNKVEIPNGKKKKEQSFRVHLIIENNIISTFLHSSFPFMIKYKTGTYTT